MEKAPFQIKKPDLITKPVSLNKKQEYEIGSWRISSMKTPILDRDQIDRYSQILQVYSLPELIFDNYLRFENIKTGFVLHFNTLDALRDAHSDVVKKNKFIDPIKVSYAWDTKTVVQQASKFLGQDKIEERDDKIDWTFTTIYKGTLENVKTKKPVKVEKTDEKLDYERLKKKEKILFYEDVCLYEDELHDNGDAVLSVKTRVMKSYFFILLRFFLRVDNVVVRILDNRIFHDYSTNYMLREYTHKQSSIKDIEQKIPLSRTDKRIFTDQVKMEQVCKIVETYTEKIYIDDA